MVILLTGPINSGKSTTVYHLVERLRSEKISIGGIVSLPILEDGQKTGFNAVCLATHKTKHLTSLKSLVPNPAPGDRIIGQWVIFDEGIQFCNQQIEAALHSNPQLLLIDEIGPLEIQGKGFQPILDKILSSPDELPFYLLLVVRTNLINEVKQLYPKQDYTILTLQDNLTDIILQKVRQIDRE